MKLKNFNNKIVFYVSLFLIEISAIGISLIIFSAAVNFLKNELAFAPLFATLSLAFGSFVTSFFAAKIKMKKGLLIGILTGILTFLTVLIISVILNGTDFTYNSLFRFIIIVFSSALGGVLGVNSSGNKKYI